MSIIIIALIAAAAAVAVLLIKEIRKPKPDKDPHRPVESEIDREPPASVPVTAPPPSPPVENHKIHPIYEYIDYGNKWVCRTCDTENPNGRSFCAVCGRRK